MKNCTLQHRRQTLLNNIAKDSLAQDMVLIVSHGHTKTCFLAIVAKGGFHYNCNIYDCCWWIDFNLLFSTTDISIFPVIMVLMMITISTNSKLEKNVLISKAKQRKKSGSQSLCLETLLVVLCHD